MNAVIGAPLAEVTGSEMTFVGNHTGAAQVAHMIGNNVTIEHNAPSAAPAPQQPIPASSPTLTA